MASGVRRASLSDSVDKIISYFECVAREPFLYKGSRFMPHGGINVGPSVFDRDWCPTMCGGCCMHSFSLDYIPSEDRPAYITGTRDIDFRAEATAGWPRIFSDLQADADYGSPCKHLDHQAYCSIHTHNPLSCVMPLLIFMVPSQEEKYPAIVHKKFGRAWAMRTLAGPRGALCEKAKDATGGPKTVQRLTQLKSWADHFGLMNTWLPDIIRWVEAGPHDEPLHLRDKRPVGYDLRLY